MNRVEQIRKNLQSDEYSYDNDLPMYDDLCALLSIVDEIRELGLDIYNHPSDYNKNYIRGLAIAKLAGFEENG